VISLRLPTTDRPWRINARARVGQGGRAPGLLDAEQAVAAEEDGQDGDKSQDAAARRLEGVSDGCAHDVGPFSVANGSSHDRAERCPGARAT
jgi:hypothetical protein